MVKETCHEGNQGKGRKEPSTSATFIWKNPVHPLFIDHILKTVLTKLAVRDLENCVDVCSQWSDEALDIIDKRQSLILRSNPSNAAEAQEHLKTIKEDIEIGITSLDFIGLGINRKQLSWKIFRQYGATLDKLNLTSCRIGSTHLAFLLRELLPNLSVLQLRSIGLINYTWFDKECYGDGINGERAKDMNWVLSQICMPRLEELTIFENPKDDYSTITEIGEPGHGYLNIYLILLMKSFPNLKSLTLRCNVRGPLKPIPTNVRAQCNWLRTLKTLKVEPVKSGMKHLDMEIFQALAFTTLSLTEINLRPWHNRSPELVECRQSLEEMWMMLVMNAGSLKDLSIIIKPKQFSDEIPVLPIFMPELASLTLSTNLIESFDHLKYFPKLKHFEIVDIELGVSLDELLARECKQVHIGVESLKITHWGIGNIGNLKKSFPNLRALDLTHLQETSRYASSKRVVTIHAIAKAFPDLEYLRMRGKADHFTESDLLGIRQEDINSRIWSAHPIAQPDQLGLKHMKYLRVVDLYPLENIHNLSLQLGFSKLEDLEFMNLSKSKITKHGLGMIVDNFPALKAVRLEKCTLVSKKELESLQEQREDLVLQISNVKDSEVAYCPRYNSNQMYEHEPLICNCFQTKEVQIKVE